MLNTIICQDALFTVRNIESDSVNLILTSLPSKFELDYGAYRDSSKEWSNYFEWVKVVLGESYRVLKQDGLLAINIAPSHYDRTPAHHILSIDAGSLGYKWQNQIVLHKPQHSYFSNRVEFIEVFSKPPKPDQVPFFQDIPVNLVWKAGRFDRSYDNQSAFTLRIAKRFIKLFSCEGQVVLDLFNGIGTTSLACAKLGRRFIGVDINQTYCDIANQRLGKFRR